MASPLGICLTDVETGKVRTFGSMIQASEFLGRSKQYIQARLTTSDPELAIDAEGNKYRISSYGHGKRKDAHRPRKVRVTKEEWKQEGYEIKNLLNHTTQLCTVCARATGFCSWSQELEPVEGWEAVPTKIRHMSKYQELNSIHETNSYRVVSCPLFIEDAPTTEGRRKQREMLIKELERS